MNDTDIHDRPLGSGSLLDLVEIRGGIGLPGEEREAVLRDPLALAMIAAWINVPVERLPASLNAHTCVATMEAWKRVGQAAVAHVIDHTDKPAFKTMDKVSRGIRWGGYKPAERLSLIQSKTGNLVNIPLVDRIDGEDVSLYPELEAELGALERRGDGDLIVYDERTGEPYTRDYMRYAHAQIRKKAGLASDLRFTSFRHGGISEIGDAGETDMRAVSGHTTLDITRLYNKANDEKARKIAARRREHISLVTAGSEE